jgi:hypothetical protein
MGVFIKKNELYDSPKPTIFTEELELSKLIINNPQIFPIHNYSDEGTKWIPISVEVRLETGELDVIGIDHAGSIYIIESKLYRNEEKKTVRQQIADYCFALLKLRERSNGWEQFCEKIANANKTKEAEPFVFHKKTLDEIIKECVSEEEQDSCLRGMKNNFEKGNYTLVILMDRIPQKLRTSIDGWNEKEVKHTCPQFALEVVEYPTQLGIGEKIIVTSTYPYDLAEIKRKKSGLRGAENDEVAFYNSLNKSNLSVEQRKIFDEFVGEIRKLADDITYGSAVTPALLPIFENVASGQRSPLVLGSDGNLRFKPDVLYDFIKESSGEIKESKLWQEKIFAIPQLEKIYSVKGWNSRYLKPDEWMPVNKEIISVLKEITRK